LEERLGIAGSGAIACGLAATAAKNGEVLLWARSAESAERAHAAISRNCAKLLGGDVDPDRVKIVTDLDGLDSATFLIEAVVSPSTPSRTRSSRPRRRRCRSRSLRRPAVIRSGSSAFTPSTPCHG
jgi:hypothetical protein